MSNTRAKTETKGLWQMTGPIFRKELRSFFLSPVALIFVGLFLLAAHFVFFWVEGFFARNVADVRPLFEWVPVLMVFLVGALGMRLWSEESSRGTVELLRTFPIPQEALVLGKFLAAWTMIAAALVLTLPIPMTVASLGNLDWGPVFGGYVATLLLGGAYLAISMWVSSTTSNQLIALALSVGALLGLLFLGSESFANYFGPSLGAVLQKAGPTYHFDAIERGVLDLRDLSYYLVLTLLGLMGNILVLRHQRERFSSAKAPTRWVVPGLLAANLIAFLVLIAPVRQARVDLTRSQIYSVSEVTKELLQNLSEPVLVRGYFSAKTHPLLDPLVPQIKDMIEEYGSLGRGKLIAEFVDPSEDEVLEKEAIEAFGIQSVPFSFASKFEESIVNAYFHVLVKSGDQFEVLSFDDLIEVQIHDMQPRVRLRNLEYDLTSSIQKVKYGFQSVASLVAQLPDDPMLTIVATEDTIPEAFASALEPFVAAAEEVARKSGGRLSVERINPDAPGAPMGRAALGERFGLKPMALSLGSEESFYLYAILSVGERFEPMMPQPGMSQAQIEESLVASLRRFGPSGMKTVGLVRPPAPQMPPQMGGGQVPRPYEGLRQWLSQSYQVEDIELDGYIEASIDVVFVVEPRGLGEKEAYTLDQFMMRGGSVVLAAGPQALSPMARGLNSVPTRSGLEAWLTHYGIRLGEDVVADAQSGTVVVPVMRELLGRQVQDLRRLAYPAFVEVRSDGMNLQNAALAGLENLTLHWPSEVALEEGAPAGGEAEVLVHSTEEAWTIPGYRSQPDFATYPELGWPGPSGEGERYTLAVAARGPFTSAYTEGVPEGFEELATSPLSESSERARLIVVGSSAVFSDLATQMGSSGINNLRWAQNLVDWSLEDVALLKIRSRSEFASALSVTDPKTRSWVELFNYAFAVIAVSFIGIVSTTRRRRARSILEGRSSTAGASIPTTTAAKGATS